MYFVKGSCYEVLLRKMMFNFNITEFSHRMLTNDHYPCEKILSSAALKKEHYLIYFFGEVSENYLLQI